MSESDFRFDKRVVEWCLQMGQLGKGEFERHLKQLKDATENATVCEVDPASIRRQLPARSFQEEEEL